MVHIDNASEPYVHHLDAQHAAAQGAPDLRAPVVLARAADRDLDPGLAGLARGGVGLRVVEEDALGHRARRVAPALREPERDREAPVRRVALAAAEVDRRLVPVVLPQQAPG